MARLDRRAGARPGVGHGIFLNDHPQIHYPHGNDFERLRDSGATVAHCPTVFARRGMVMNSIGRYMNAGITVGIGTDTFPHNMLDEIRWSATSPASSP